jgi:uncharacterized protein YaeQ
MTRGLYRDFSLTIARHPSETDERMMVRVLAFALHADDALSFGRGLSTDDEPDLWERDLTGAIVRWIDVGLPDERDVRKALGRADQVNVYAYGGRAVDLWWSKARDRLQAQERLAVMQLPLESSRALAQLAARSMKLTCSIDEGSIQFADSEAAVAIELVALKTRSASS